MVVDTQSAALPAVRARVKVRIRIRVRVGFRVVATQKAVPRQVSCLPARRR